MANAPPKSFRITHGLSGKRVASAYDKQPVLRMRRTKGRVNDLRGPLYVTGEVELGGE
jgi:hypothetical protein